MRLTDDEFATLLLTVGVGVLMLLAILGGAFALAWQVGAL